MAAELNNAMMTLAGVIMEHTETLNGSSGRMSDGLVAHVKKSHYYDSLETFDRYCARYGQMTSAFVGISQKKFDEYVCKVLWGDRANRNLLAAWLCSDSEHVTVTADCGEVVGYRRMYMNDESPIEECTSVRIGLIKGYDEIGRELIIITTVFPVREEDEMCA